MKVNSFTANSQEVKKKGKYMQASFESVFKGKEERGTDLSEKEWEALFDQFASMPIEEFRATLKKLIAGPEQAATVESKSNSKNKPAKTEAKNSGDGENAGA